MAAEGKVTVHGDSGKQQAESPRRRVCTPGDARLLFAAITRPWKPDLSGCGLLSPHYRSAHVLDQEIDALEHLAILRLRSAAKHPRLDKLHEARSRIVQRQDSRRSTDAKTRRGSPARRWAGSSSCS